LALLFGEGAGLRLDDLGFGFGFGFRFRLRGDVPFRRWFGGGRRVHR
jgi:hypothetical protein